MQPNNGAAAQNAQLPFKIVKDGWGTEHKVIDLDHPGLIPREGIIIFEATTRKNAERAGDIPFKMTVDKLSKVQIGIFAGIADHKALMWKPIRLGKTTMFNLEIEEEAKMAWCLQRSNIVEGSPNLSTSIRCAFFRVHDEMKEATLTINRINEGQRAISISKGLLGEDLTNHARNLGINTEHANHAIILAAVMKRAQDNPEEFLRIYENPNRDQITIFKRGVDTGVIVHDPITGYSFRGITLGPNEPFVVEYFLKHKDIASSIDMLSRERLKKPTPAPAPVDTEKEALQRQIDDLQAQLKASKEVPSDLQAEFDQALVEAKTAEVKSTHLYKPTRESIDKLKAATLKAKEVTM